MKEKHLWKILHKLRPEPLKAQREVAILAGNPGYNA
jgi:hypothetical protein